MKGKSSPVPIVIGLVAGAALAAAGVWAYTVFLPRGEAVVAPAPESGIAVPPEAEPITFAVVEGPAPGQDTPYSGALASFARWRDADGEHMAILSLLESPAAGIEARHYRRGGSDWRLVAEVAESGAPDSIGATAGFYKDGPWASDLDGDGRGEALLAYWIDDSPEAGPKRLRLVAFVGDGVCGISGGTRFDPADAPRVAPVAAPDDAMAAAPEAIRAEAEGIWADAQFDLAEPPAFPGFFAFRRFAEAEFRGEDPFWTLAVLPQYMLLNMADGEEPAVIRYEALKAEESGVVIDGKGEVEAWSHGFRVTVREESVTAPDGRTFPFSATVDWSDGTRLTGWGRLAE